MKNKKGLILLLILLLLAGYFYFTRDKGTISSELKDFAVKDTASVERIFIATQDGETADLKRDGNQWLINNDYKARQDAIDLLLETFYRIDIVSPVSQSEFDNVVKQLASSGTKVEIYDDADDEPIKTYYVGGATANHKGTYMLLEIDGEKSSLPFVTYVPGFYGYLSTRFFTEETLWRDRALFKGKGEEIEMLSFQYGREPEKSFTIKKLNDSYEVRDAGGSIIEIRNPLIIEEYLDLLCNSHYEYIDVDMEESVKDSVVSSTPLHVITTTNSAGEVSVVKTFLKPLTEKQYDINTGEKLTHNLDRCSGLINGEDFVTIQYVILDEIAVTSEDIRNNNGVNK